MGRRRGEFAHHAMHALAVRRTWRHAVKRISGGAVGNVLVKARAGLFLRQQEFPVLVGESKRDAAEENDLAALQLVAIPRSRLRRRSRHVHGHGGIESCHAWHDNSFRLRWPARAPRTRNQGCFLFGSGVAVLSISAMTCLMD